jgi:RNA polymerase sigma-70 factor (ECF subfamily)
MDPASGGAPDPRAALLATYDVALPQVYGYLLSRCRRRELAEDLTAETFLAAVDAVRRDQPPPVDVAWLIGVARHKLVDHWRRLAREERSLRAVESDRSSEPADDWPGARVEALLAAETLEQLSVAHRLALTLRYVDDLPVAEVAALLGRTLHATEALLVRARTAFRAAYPPAETGDDRG